MARTINKVELLGRVGTDPEMKYTQGGTAVTQLRLATDRRRQDGETDRGRLAQRRRLGQGRRGGEPVRRQGRPHLRRRTPGPEHLGGGRRTAALPHRDSRLRGRLPRLQGRNGGQDRTTTGRRTSPLPSSRSTHDRTATPSRRRATGPLPSIGTAPLPYRSTGQASTGRGKASATNIEEEPKWHAPSTR